jgi:hypothetical protein
MKISTTMRYHLIAVRIAVFFKKMKGTCCSRYGEKGTLEHC